MNAKRLGRPAGRRVATPLSADRQALAAQWVPFAFQRAHKYAAQFHTVDIDDLTSAAMDGLMYAAEMFDETRAKFGAIAGLAIHQHLHREICRQIAAGFGGVISDLCNGRKPWAELPVRFHLESPLGDRTTVGDSIADPAALDPTEDVEADGTASVVAVRAAVDLLPGRLRTVVARRLRGDKLHDIGADLGVCKERVRQLEVAGHACLRAIIDREDRRSKGDQG